MNIGFDENTAVEEYIIDIRDKNDVIKHRYALNSKDIEKNALMSEHYIQLEEFSLDNLVKFVRTDYIIWEGEKYMIKEDYIPDQVNKINYKYTLRFDHWTTFLQDDTFYYTNQNLEEADWSLMSNAATHFQLIADNANRYFGVNTFNVGTIEFAEMKLLQFSKVSIWDAATQIADAYKAEWYLTGTTFHLVKKFSYGSEVDFESEVSVEKMDRSEGENSEKYTRILPFGSTRNIPANYRETTPAEAADAIYQKRLRIPESKGNFIDIRPNLSPEEVKSAVVIFDDIYPKRIGTMSSISTVEYTETDETIGVVTKWNAYRYKDIGLSFKEEYRLPGIELRIVFQSGALNGTDYEVKFNPLGKAETDPESQLFEIIRNEDYGKALPNDILKPQNGDTYILYGFDIKLVSDQYVPAGELELFDTATQWLADNNKDKSVFECPTMMQHFEANEMDLEIGQKVKLIHSQFEGGFRSSRIQGYEKHLLNKYQATYTVGDNATYSRYRELEESVKELQIAGITYQATGSNGVYIIKQFDNTPASDFNAYSAKASDAKYLNKQTGGTVQGDTTFQKKVKAKEFISDQFGNETFTSGQFGNGFRAWLAANGQSYAEFDNLMVRREMIINTLTIAEIKSVGGQILLSLANMYCNGVTDGGTYWKCAFDTANGTITNQFAVDDQVICRRFNGANVKYYWARVTSVGPDFINISKSDRDGSGIPAVNDEIIQLGNRTNTSRQSAIVLSAYGSDAPSIKQYAGINSYNLTGKEVTVISPSGNKFTGDFTIQSSGTNVTTAIDNAKNTAITAAATDATNKVNAIQVGGSNLLANSSFSSNINPWLGNGTHTISLDRTNTYNGYNSLKCVSTGSGNPDGTTNRFYRLRPTVSGNYLFSFYAKADQPITLRVRINNVIEDFQLTTEWKRFVRTTPQPDGNIVIWLASSGTMWMACAQLEEGNKVTAWRLAEEEIKENIDAANTAASNASTAASNAQTSANTANTLLADIANDNLLIPSEKQDVLKEWQIIQGEYPTVVAQATTYSVSSSDYTTKYNALNTYITPLLSSMTTNSAIVGTTFRSTFKAYYDAKISLLKLVTDKAKSIADQAQTDASAAKSNAQIAQSAAEAAQTTATTAKNNADTANTLLTDIASDNKLTPNEKSSVRQEWNVIAAEISINNTQADTFGITTEKSTYNSAFQTLANYLNNGTIWSTGVPSWISDTNLSVTTTIVGNTFRANWKAYYDARTILLNAIAKKSKQLADAAQSSADTANAGLLTKVAYSEYNAQMTIVNNQISSKVSQTDFNSLNQRVGTTESQVTQQAGQITSVVETVNNIQIGGINLFVTHNLIRGTGGQHIGKPYPEGMTYRNDRVRTELFKVSPNTEYIITNIEGFFFAFCGFDSDKIGITDSSWFSNASKFIYKTPINVEYLVAIVRKEDSSTITIQEVIDAKIQIEKGNKATDYSPAPEDVDYQVKQVEEKANQAQADANKANSVISDIANDNKLTPNEKQIIAKDWGDIQKEYPSAISEANKFGISTTAYTNAYNALNTYITPLLADLATTNDIIGSTFRLGFNTYRDEYAKLLNAISTKAKDLADNAQTTANNAQTTADGKNRTYYQDAQPTVPSGGFTIGDIWQKITYTDINGNINSDTTKNVCRLEYRWNGTTWVQINVNVSGSYVTQTNDSITSLVTKTGINGLGVGETLKSLIDQTPGQIELAVSAVRYDTKNLVLNSSLSRIVPIGDTNNNIADIPFNAGDVVSFGCDVSFGDSDLINQILLIQEIDVNNVRVHYKWSNENTSPTGSGVFKRISGTHIMQNNGYFRLGLRSNGTTSPTTFKNIKIENSSKPTKYTSAPEDIQAEIVMAQTAATNAATAASNADTKATTANNLLTDIANDNKLDPAEKQSTKKEWDIIVSEYSKNIAQANSFTVSTTVYTSAYNSLNSYITPLLSNLSTTSDIVGTTFRSTFKAYYDARTDLLNAISTKAKAIADSKTDLDTVKAGITINTDGVTAFGNQFKVDTTLIANAIQTEELNVGNGSFRVGTDGKISAKGAAIEGSLEIGWDGDVGKPINRITVVDRSSSNQKTKVLITPQNITSLSSIGGNTTSSWIVSGGAATSYDVSNGNSYTFAGANLVLAAGKTYDVIIPVISFMASADNAGEASYTMYLDNLNTGESILALINFTSGESITDNAPITMAGLPSGTYRLRIILYTYGANANSSFSIAGLASYTIRPITDAVEIGANGMCGIFTSSRYFHATTDGFFIRMGNYGFRISETYGIQKSTNLNNPSPTWTNI